MLLKATIQNTGRVPSRGLTLDWQFVTQPQTSDEFLVDVGTTHTSTATETKAFGGSETIIPPSAADYFTVIKIPPSVVSKMTDVKHSPSDVLLVGGVYYGTGFGEVDNADFCFHLQQFPKPTWAPCQFGAPGNLNVQGMKNRYNAEKQKRDGGK